MGGIYTCYTGNFPDLSSCFQTLRIRLCTYIGDMHIQTIAHCIYYYLATTDSPSTETTTGGDSVPLPGKVFIFTDRYYSTCAL